MCGSHGWHEDFEDAPEVEERFPDDQQFTDEERREYEEHLDDADDFGSDEYDAEYDAELQRDAMLDRQELEDFEGLSGFNDFDDHFDHGGESGW